MRHDHQCLNCESTLSGNFCSNCGQKSAIHRITFRHFIFHDILHGVWHLEKGILFTSKQALVRPGKAALEYLSGKRIRYYNVFYLTLLLIGLNLFINHLQDQLSHYYFNTVTKLKANSPGAAMDAFLGNNSKLIILSFIPLFATNSFLIFRRKKLNFSEHFIISGMMFLGVMVITTITSLFYFTYYLKYIDFFTGIVNVMAPLLILVYLTVNYYKTFSEDYTRFQASLRVSLFILLLLIELVLLILLLFGYFSDWKFKF